MLATGKPNAWGRAHIIEDAAKVLRTKFESSGTSTLVNGMCIETSIEKQFLMRIPKAHVILSYSSGKSCCRSGHSALQATRRMPLWALAIALATGKNTKLFGVLDQNENGFFTYVSQRAGSKTATVVTSD